MKQENKEFSMGERLYAPREHLTTDQTGGVMAHLDRYRFVLQFITGKELIIDAACGSGYGSELLAAHAKNVIGLEINDHALTYARKNHQKTNIEFQKSNLNQSIKLPDNCAYIIVSFETLEHLVNQDIMLAEFKRILKPNGLCIISTPDKDLISGGLQSDNPFHAKELTKKEFIALMKRHFVLESLYGQMQTTALPLWKQRIKSLRVFTPLRRVKQFIVKILGLQKFVHKHFAAEQYSPIQRVAITEPNQFYVLIAVCRNVK